MKMEDLSGFNYSLIETLTGEHKQIRLIYNNIMSAAVDRQYADVDVELEKFGEAIRAHYGYADRELYSCIAEFLKYNFPNRKEAFDNISLEMKKIAVEILTILTKSPNLPLSGQTYSEFMVEFLKIGKVMNERIIREETVLFKMYELALVTDQNAKMLA